MSGIVLCSQPNALSEQAYFEKVLKSYCFGDLVVKASYQNHFLNAALLSTPESEGSVFHDEERGLFFFVDGYFVDNLGTTESSAQWLYSRYQENGNYLFSDLNGSYNILVIDERARTYTLLSDRYGTRPLFYLKSAGSFAIGPFGRQLTELCKVKPILNETMVANQLSYSRVWLKGETFFKGVHNLPAASHVMWNEAKGPVFKELVPRWREVERLSGDVQELTDTLRSVVTDFNKIDHVGISLSGGLDSRLLLAAGFNGPAYTWGYQIGNDEISIAHDVANLSGNEWNFVKVAPEDFLDRSGVGDKFREGLDIFVQSYAFSAYPRVKCTGITGLVTGLALDVTMGGSYNIGGLSGSWTNDVVFDHLRSKSEYFSAAEREKLISNPHIAEEIKGLTEFIHEASMAAPKGNPALAIQNYFFDFRIRRYIFQRQQWQRLFLEDYIPTFDNRLINLLRGFKQDELSNHKVFCQTLDKLNPDLMTLPYQRTMLPVNVPVSLWADSARLEAEKETLFRHVFAETNGQVFIPYNRYYSNFDEWLRLNEAWKEQCQVLLMSQDTILLDYCDGDIIRKWIASQLSGGDPNHSKLIQLMSLEKTLRTHFA